MLRICVPTKIVPRAAVKARLDPATFRLDRSGASEMNPADAHAVEEALVVREAVGGGEVVAVAMGPAGGAEGLRAALAMGADRAVMAADPAFAGADVVATARVLAALIAQEAPGLVVFGALSADGGGAMLWAAVAEFLGQPLLSGARGIQVTDGRARVSRTTTDGVVVLEAPLPCVVALSGPVNAPRYPTFRDVLVARKREILLRSAADLGLDPAVCGSAGSRTEVLGVGAPPPGRKPGRIIEDDGHAAAWLYQLLTERGMA